MQLRKVLITVALVYLVRLRCCSHSNHGVTCAADMMNHIRVISCTNAPHIAGPESQLNRPKIKNTGAGASERMG
jgi:hypothetical protein